MKLPASNTCSHYWPLLRSWWDKRPPRSALAQTQCKRVFGSPWDQCDTFFFALFFPAFTFLDHWFFVISMVRSREDDSRAVSRYPAFSSLKWIWLAPLQAWSFSHRAPFEALRAARSKPIELAGLDERLWRNQPQNGDRDKKGKNCSLSFDLWLFFVSGGIRKTVTVVSDSLEAVIRMFLITNDVRAFVVWAYVFATFCK